MGYTIALEEIISKGKTYEIMWVFVCLKATASEQAVVNWESWFLPDSFLSAVTFLCMTLVFPFYFGQLYINPALTPTANL